MENHTLFHAVHQLSRQLTKKVNEALQPFGLHHAQWSVLYALQTKGSMTQAALCSYLAVEAPPMTRTIQRLVKQGYVEQTAGADKRAKYITLTDTARALFPEWEQAIFTMQEQVLAGLPAELQPELQTLIRTWLWHLKGEGNTE